MAPGITRREELRRANPGAPCSPSSGRESRRAVSLSSVGRQRYQRLPEAPDMSGVAGTGEIAAVPKRSLHDDGQTDEGQDGRSRRSPWPGLAIVLALRRRSAASERPTSSLSLMQPLASRRTERAAVAARSARAWRRPSLSFFSLSSSSPPSFSLPCRPAVGSTATRRFGGNSVRRRQPRAAPSLFQVVMRFGARWRQHDRRRFLATSSRDVRSRQRPSRQQRIVCGRGVRTRGGLIVSPQ